MHLSISLCISQMFIGHTHYYISFSVFEGTTITTLSLIYLYYIYIYVVGPSPENEAVQLWVTPEKKHIHITSHTDTSCD